MLQPASKGAVSEISVSDTYVPAEISAQQAFDLLSEQTNHSILIDVRTSQEQKQYGRPNINFRGGEYHLIEWRTMPDFAANPQFIDQLKAVAAKADDLFFMCKAGVRSDEAARLAMQFTDAKCYNIVGGTHGQQGWLEAQLPWEAAK